MGGIEGGWLGGGGRRGVILTAKNASQSYDVVSFTYSDRKPPGMKNKPGE